MSTGFGKGVAISHGESSELDHVTIAMGVSKQGIEFASMDGEPVHVLFLIVNPREKRGAYLQTLAMLTRMLRLSEVRNKLQCCTCCGEIEQTLETALESSAGAI